MTKDDWATLVGSIQDSDCLVFLGAGASTVLQGQVGLPTGGQLSQKLAAECEYPGLDKTDFLRVCQYYELVRDGHRLRKAICKELDIPNLRPGELHNLIAKLPIKYVLTTNYDSLMEMAFKDAGKNVRVVVYDIHETAQKEIDGATKERPVVYKLHGTIDDVGTMLCTEDDIVQFLACIILGNPPLMQGIKQLFEDYTMLFIGYGLRDWNIRTMNSSHPRSQSPGQRLGEIVCFAASERFVGGSCGRLETNGNVLGQERERAVSGYRCHRVRA